MNVLAARPRLGTRRPLAALGGGAWYGYEARQRAADPRRDASRATPRASRARTSTRSRRACAALPPGAATLAAVRDAAQARCLGARCDACAAAFPTRSRSRLEAHEALARWSDGAAREPARRGVPAPHAGEAAALHRARGHRAPRWRASIRAIARALAPLGHRRSPSSSSRARGAWQVVLDSGLVLELGPRRRASRASSASPPRGRSIVQRRTRAPRYADLRYPNGFALSVARPERPARRKKRA